MYNNINYIYYVYYDNPIERNSLGCEKCILYIKSILEILIQTWVLPAWPTIIFLISLNMSYTKYTP